MRTTSQSAIIVWCGTLLGVAYWTRIWLAKLMTSHPISDELLSFLTDSPLVLLLFSPALLGLYAINAGIPLRCPLSRVGYGTYAGLILVIFVCWGPLPDETTDQMLSHGMATVICAAISVAVAAVILSHRIIQTQRVS